MSQHQETQDYCEVCGKPAVYDVSDVNGTPDGVTLWVSVCGDACADRVVAGSA